MSYNVECAKKYWEKRIEEKGEKLSSVLYYAENETINAMYDMWEKSLIKKYLKSSYNAVLDVPVGIGRWTNELNKISKKIYCVDISEQILEKAANNVQDHIEKIRYIKSDVGSINLDLDSLDLILCTGLFEHLPQNEYARAIQKFSSLLKSNGELILVINNNNSLFLREKADNRYRKNMQLRNGYFNALTDLQFVISEITKCNFKVNRFSFNPNFSVLRKCISNNVENTEILEICKKAIQNDVTYFSDVNKPYDIVSDQIVIWCTKE